MRFELEQSTLPQYHVGAVSSGSDMLHPKEQAQSHKFLGPLVTPIRFELERPNSGEGVFLGVRYALIPKGQAQRPQILGPLRMPVRLT